MDSGVSILNLSVGRCCACLGLSLTSTFDEAWGPETNDCKTREILHFTPFLLRSLTKETGYKRPELDLFDDSCILSESEELWLILVLS